MSLANTGEKTYRILVFGSHSAGKTSIINMLTGEKNRASNSIEGTTFSFKDSIYLSNEEGDKNIVYKFMDTIGLNNDFKLEISSIEHLKNLIVESHEGYIFLIHVKRIGAIVNTLQVTRDLIEALLSISNGIKILWIIETKIYLNPISNVSHYPTLVN